MTCVRLRQPTEESFRGSGMSGKNSSLDDRLCHKHWTGHALRTGPKEVASHPLNGRRHRRTERAGFQRSTNKHIGCALDLSEYELENICCVVVYSNWQG